MIVVFWGEIRAWFSSPEVFRERILALGSIGPLVSVLLSALQVVLAPIPGQFIGVANGFVYGLWVGVAVSTIGLALGSAIAMGLGRWLGRDLVERLVAKEKLARFDAITTKPGAALVFFLVFLVPGVPDDMACFAIGLSALPLPRMLVLSTVGRFPGMLAASYIGAHATELPRGALIAAAIATTVVGIALVFAGDRLEEGILRRISRWRGRK